MKLLFLMVSSFIFLNSLTAHITIKNDTGYRLFLYSTKRARTIIVDRNAEQNVNEAFFSADISVTLFGDAEGRYEAYSSVVYDYAVEDGSMVSFSFTTVNLSEDIEIPKLQISHGNKVKYYNLNEVLNEDELDSE